MTETLVDAGFSVDSKEVRKLLKRRTWSVMGLGRKQGRKLIFAVSSDVDGKARGTQIRFEASVIPDRF